MGGLLFFFFPFFFLFLWVLNFYLKMAFWIALKMVWGNVCWQWLIPGNSLPFLLTQLPLMLTAMKASLIKETCIPLTVLRSHTFHSQNSCIFQAIPLTKKIHATHIHCKIDVFILLTVCTTNTTDTYDNCQSMPLHWPTVYNTINIPPTC